MLLLALGCALLKRGAVVPESAASPLCDVPHETAAMPIQVTCPSCHARFKVSEKFAGQTGPCPKCKNKIRIPLASEEVVIHADEDFGPKDASGRGVLKPVEREETAASPVAIVGIVAACLVVLIVTFVLGRAYRDSGDGVPLVFLGVGAALLGPPLAVAGYGLLRDQELAPFRGASLWMRATVCGLVYAALWAAYWYVKSQLFEGEIEIFQLVFIGPALVAAGGVASLASLELDYTSGMLHYGLYLLVTGMLRLLVGLPIY